MSSIPPSMPLVRQLELTGDDAAVARKVLNSLRFRIERLIDQELLAIPSNGAKTARESRPVQPELFDDETGEQIFG